LFYYLCASQHDKEKNKTSQPTGTLICTVHEAKAKAQQATSNGRQPTADHQ
jgi:hypothetical protein